MITPREKFKHQDVQKSVSTELKKAMMERLRTLYPEFFTTPAEERLVIEFLEPAEAGAIILKMSASFVVTLVSKKENPD